jgi:UDP-GlcNAc:undecaprenyl-phosphate GlcNAc-1-phosphate transferase
MLANILVSSAAFIVSLIFNWILTKFSLNLGVRNLTKEEEIRWQHRKPSVGGIAFYICFLIFFSIISLSFQTAPLFKNQIQLSLLISCSLGFIIGLIDDARNTNPIWKLLGQTLCAIVLCSFDIVIPFSPNLLWNYVLTVFWVVFLMNSINMLDNMDGLTTTISIFILFSIVISQPQSESFYIVLTYCIIGILFGFLFFNWNPSRIYMGDSGSQFLGILLAHISIVYLWDNRSTNGGYFQVEQFILPMMFFTVPIYDTMTVFIHRLLKGNSPFVGGRDHLSHHLVYLGFKDYQSVFILSMVNFSAIAIGFYCFSNYRPYLLFLFGLWIIGFLFVQILYKYAERKSAQFQ